MDTDDSDHIYNKLYHLSLKLSILSVQNFSMEFFSVFLSPILWTKDELFSVSSARLESNPHVSIFVVPFGDS